MMVEATNAYMILPCTPVTQLCSLGSRVCKSFILLIRLVCANHLAMDVYRFTLTIHVCKLRKLWLNPVPSQQPHPYSPMYICTSDMLECKQSCGWPGMELITISFIKEYTYAVPYIA